MSFSTDTHGEGILNTIFDGYDEWRGDLPARSTGSLISYETGVAVAYGLFNAQQRGTLIVDPGDKVYEGMVVGYSPAGEDITVNVVKPSISLIPAPPAATTRCAWCLCPNSVWKKVWNF